jgi:cold shock CspA family protein
MALVTDRRARFSPFSSNRSTNEGADPSAPKSHVYVVMSTLNEGQNVCFGVVADRRSGKSAGGKSAIENLRAV